MIFTSLRKFTKVIMWGIAIFIVPAFVIWNVGSAVRSRRSGFAGEIFQRKVAWKDFFREKQAARNELWMRFGDQMKNGPDVNDQAWTRLILREEANRRNIKVSNDELITHIKTLPIFRFSEMDPRTYAEVIARVFQQSPADFEDGMRTSLIIAKLMEQVASGVTASDIEIKQAYLNEHEKAAVDYIVVSNEELLSQVPADNETAMNEYYTAHAADFKKPEQADVEYLAIKLESFKDQITITDEQVQEYYERNKEQYRVPDADLATAAPAANDPTAPASPPEEKPAAYKPLADLSTSIRDILREKDMNERASLQARDIMNRLYTEQDLAKAAAEFSLSVQRTGPFSMMEEIPTVGLNFPFVQAAFSLKPGEISEVIKSPTAYYILRLAEKIAPYVPAYEDVREPVKKAYIDEQAQLLAKQKAAGLSVDIKKLVAEQNMTFSAAAASLGREIKSLDDVTRAGYLKDIGYANEFAQAAFSLKPGAVSDAVQFPRGYAVISVKQIFPIDEQALLAEREKYRQQVLTERKTTYLTDWFNALKERAKPVSFLEEDKR